MRRVPPPLAELTAQARTLTSAGDLVGARAVLADALTPVDADPQRASPDLATAAALLARILIALGDPHAARIWAGFAHAAEDRLHGSHDERTVAAAALHAAVLHRVGSHGRAARLYQDLVRTLAALDGPDSSRVLAAEADQATAEHAAGQCTAARERLADAWARHRRAYGDADPAGIKMLARLGAMDRECGRDREAHEHLALAQELSARYLPADHPLAAQTAALAQAPASGRHLCGRVTQSTGPVAAPGVVPVHRPAPPGVRTVHPPAVPGDAPAGPPPRRMPPPRRPEARGEPTTAEQPGPPDPGTGPVPSPSASPPPAAPSGPGGPSGGPGGAHPAAPRTDPARPGELAEPDDRETDPKGAVYQQPLYLSDLQSPPGELTGRHARADTPPPLPGQRAPEVGPDGREIRIGAAQLPPSLRVTPPDQRLPVPVAKRESRSWQPLVLVAALIAGIAVAAAVVITTLPRGAGKARPASSTIASAPVASGSAGAAPRASASVSSSPVGGPAPANVRIQDNRDSVSLSWGYPKGSEGPVLISGGRAGQPQRAFQQLPAGTTNYVVYGLNEQSNYCFTVAIVYSVDDVAASRRMCTSRR